MIYFWKEPQYTFSWKGENDDEDLEKNKHELLSSIYSVRKSKISYIEKQRHILSLKEYAESLNYHPAVFVNPFISFTRPNQFVERVETGSIGTTNSMEIVKVAKGMQIAWKAQFSNDLFSDENIRCFKMGLPDAEAFCAYGQIEYRDIPLFTIWEYDFPQITTKCIFVQ